jgi:hypothetical protein
VWRVAHIVAPSHANNCIIYNKLKVDSLLHYAVSHCSDGLRANRLAGGFMFNRVTTITFLATALFSAVLAAIGCSGKAASIRQEKARTLAASAPRTTVATVAKTVEHVAKPAPRDPTYARYSDPDYGVSFRYPRNFALLDSVEDDDADSDRMLTWQQAKEAGAGVRTVDELEADEPGATLLATIVVPEDAYPNTSFAGGSLQFAVNRYQTASNCRANLLARSGDAKSSSGTATGQGIAFAWIDTDSGDGNTEFYERNYAGFANDACYEFFVRVGVAPGPNVSAVQTVSAAQSGANGDNSSVTSEESAAYRAPNERKLIAHLEKIVTSLQVEPLAASVLDKPKYKAAPVLPASN